MQSAEVGVIGFVSLTLSFVAAYAAALTLSRFTPRPQNHITSIDGLRGYLALSVLASHFLLNWNYSLGFSWGTFNSTVFENLGPCAVILFFMITSFLFYGKVIKPAQVHWRSLYIKRFYRIVPMYWVVVSIMVVIIILHQAGIAVAYSDLALSILRWFTFTDLTRATVDGYDPTIYVTAAVTWTLRYEWLFYFSLPIIAVLARLASAQVRSIAILLAIVTVSGASFFAPPLNKAVPFLFGFLAYETVSCRKSRNYFPLDHSLSTVVMLIALAIALLSPGGGYAAWRDAVLFFVFVPIAFGNGFWGLLSRPASVILGDASYSIYLIHGLFLHVLFNAFSTEKLSWLILPVSATAMSLIAVFTYRFIELPFIKIGQSYSPSDSRQSMTLD